MDTGNRGLTRGRHAAVMMINTRGTLRTVLDVLRLRLVYDGRTGTADCTVTVTDDTLTAVWGAIGAMSDAVGASGLADGLETNGATGAQGRLFPSVVRPRQGEALMGTRRGRSRTSTLRGSFRASKPRRLEVTQPA